MCAISGANKPINESTTGNTQQNKCGKMDATIPILTARFFIYVCPLVLISVSSVRCRHFVKTSWRKRQGLDGHKNNLSVASPAGLEPASNS